MGGEGIPAAASTLDLSLGATRRTNGADEILRSAPLHDRHSVPPRANDPDGSLDGGRDHSNQVQHHHGAQYQHQNGWPPADSMSRSAHSTPNRQRSNENGSACDECAGEGGGHDEESDPASPEERAEFAQAYTHQQEHAPGQQEDHRSGRPELLQLLTITLVIGGVVGRGSPVQVLLGSR